jgi:predicted deacylase
VVVFHCEPGDVIQAGDAVADVVDIDSGQVHTLHAQSSGVLYARIATRWATPGKRLCKIAGTTLARTGKLLSN